MFECCSVKECPQPVGWIMLYKPNWVMQFVEGDDYATVSVCEEHATDAKVDLNIIEIWEYNVLVNYPVLFEKKIAEIEKAIPGASEGS